MKILNNFITWFAETDLYTDFFSKLPEGINNVYLDAIILIVLIIVGVGIIYETIATFIFRLILNKRSNEQRKIKLQLEKEKMELERSSLHDSADQKLFFQYMQFLMINQISSMTFEQWKNQNYTQMAKANEPKDGKETADENIPTVTDEIKESESETVVNDEADLFAEETTSESDDNSEIQVEELLPATELVDEIQSEESSDTSIDISSVLGNDPEPETESAPVEESKQIVDVAAIIAEKEKEQLKNSETDVSGESNAFEMMMKNLTQHQNDVAKEKELNAEISKITEKNMAVLEERFTSGLHMETDDIETHLDKMTDEQMKELEKTRKRIEKEEAKKIKAANRKPLFGKKKEKGGTESENGIGQ